MMTPSPKFKGEILRQVYRVWLVRRWLPVLVIEVLVLTVLLYKFAQVVFVQRVVENASNVLITNPTGIVRFFVVAFSQSAPVTKLVAIILVVLVALLLRHLTQGLLRFILVRENFFEKAR